MKKLLSTFAFFCGLLIASSAQTTNGLIAKYYFDSGNANDEVGSNHGTISGAVLTTDRFGNADHAYYFDGVNDFLSLGNSTSIKPTTATISVWVNMSGISTTGSGYLYNPICTWKNDSTQHYFEAAVLYIRTTDRRPLAFGTNPVGFVERFIYDNDSMRVGEWKHLAMSYDDDSLAFYVNGVLENRIYKGFVSVFHPNEEIFFAKSGSRVNNRYFHGILDDILIYNRVLTDEEISDIYSAANPLSVDEAANENSAIQLFPNPARDIVTLSQVPAGAAINIVDLNGRSLLAEFATTDGIAEINTTALANGVYFVRVAANGATHNSKLIINR